MKHLPIFLLPLAFGISPLEARVGAEVTVEILRTPDGGLQPTAVVDQAGALHLVTLKNEEDGADILYLRQDPSSGSFSHPVRVNTQPKSVHRYGPIARPEIAVGTSGRVHVTWMSMDPPQFFYSRTNEDASGFEPERELMTRPLPIEAGASVAVDSKGTVVLLWHAGAFRRAAERGVYLVRSENDGESFTNETRIVAADSGACPCCGLKAIFDHQDKLYVSFRSAAEEIHRDMTLLVSSDGGRSFTSSRLHPWEIDACPVSTTTLALARTAGTFAAWETEGQLYLTSLSAPEGAPPVPAPGTPETRRKNPNLAVNEDGAILLTWGSAFGFKAGGTLHWQVFDPSGAPTEVKGRAEESIPDFSGPAAVARPDGSFVIIY